MNRKNIPFNLIRFTSALILFIAIADHPYGYYRFVRLFTFAVCGYGFYKAYSIKNKLFSWIFGIIAIVFNPLYSFYFGKDLWHIIDVLSGIIIILSIFLFNLPKYKHKQKKNYNIKIRIKQIELKTYKAIFKDDLVYKSSELCLPQHLKLFDLSGNCKKEYNYELNLVKKDFNVDELTTEEASNKLSESWEWIEDSYKYDKYGKVIEEFKYDSENKLIKKTINNYNEKGNLINSDYYNSNMILKSKKIVKYDDISNINVISNYNSDNILKNKQQFKYKDNKIIESQYFIGDKIDEIWTYKYDKEDNVIEKSLFCNCILESEPDLTWKFQYDKYGNEILWDQDYEDIVNTYTYKYDKNGNWTEKISFEKSVPDMLYERRIEYYNGSKSILRHLKNLRFKIFQPKEIFQFIKVIDSYEADLLNDWRCKEILDEYINFLVPIESIIAEIKMQLINTIIKNSHKIRKNLIGIDRFTMYKRINNTAFHHAQKKIVGDDYIYPRVRGYDYIMKRALRLKMENDEISESKRQEIINEVHKTMF